MAKIRSTIMRRMFSQTLQCNQSDNLSEEILSAGDIVVIHKLSFISRLSLIHEILLSTYYVPGIVLGTGDTVVNKRDKNSCPLGSWLHSSSHMGVCLDVSGVELYAQTELGWAGHGRGTQILIPWKLDTCSLSIIQASVYLRKGTILYLL